jgi:PST family polysaccharide transporter
MIGQLIALLRTIVIARILLPEELGIMGMALTLIAALTAVTTTGMDQSLLAQQFTDRNDLQTQLNTVWTAELIRSSLLALLVSGCAIPLAGFYGEPRLRLIIPVLSLTVLIQGWQNIGLVLLRKEISFARLFWYELANNVGGIIVTIGLVLLLRNVWGLVLALVAGAALSTALSYFVHSYRPRLAIEGLALRQSFNFGKFALIIATASYITTMADNVIVGRLLGSAALGKYALAYNLASVPIGVLVYALGRVLFPAYAEIATQRPKQLRQAFTKVFTISSLLLIMIAVPMFLLAGDIVWLLFGPRWVSAGAPLRVLTLIIPLRGLVLIVSAVFFGLNLPRKVAMGKTIEAIIFLALLYPLTVSFGMIGAAWAGVITYAIASVNRALAMREIIPGIVAGLLRISGSTLVSATAGVLIGSRMLRMVHSPAPRVLVVGLLSSTIAALVFCWINADLRKWLRDW